MKVFLIPKNYRYKHLIHKEMEIGDIKRLKSFIKMGKLIVMDL